MRSRLFFPTFLASGVLLFVFHAAAQVDTLWLKRFDGTASKHDNAARLITDADGNLYIVGSTNAAGSPPADYVTIKLRPNGDTAWVRTYNGPINGQDQAVGVVLDNQRNVYVTGESEDASSAGVYATVKYDSSGNELWVRRYGPPEPYYSRYQAVAIGIDAASNIYVSGTHWNLIIDSFGGLNNADIVTLKYDKDGNLLWTRSYTGEGYYVWTYNGTNFYWRYTPSLDGFHAMHVDAVGNVAIAGQVQPFGYYSTYLPGFNYITLSYPSSPSAEGAPSPAAGSVRSDVRQEDAGVKNAAGSVQSPGAAASQVRNDCGLMLMSTDRIPGQTLARPTLSGPEVMIVTSHFRVHYCTSGSDSTTVLWADSVAADAEDVWAKYSALGWQMPPPDGANGGDALYDVYIDDAAPKGYFGVCWPESPYAVVYPDGYTSYLEVHRDSLSAPFPKFPRLRALLAHEFFHAVQMSYSASETPLWAFYENCSVWGERLLYKDITTLPYRFLTEPSNNSLISPELSVIDTQATYEYTGALWPTFLNEFYGGTVLRSIWERLGSHTGANLMQDIDSTLRASSGSNLREALRRYGVWRFFTGARADTAHYFKDGNLWPTSWILARRSVYPASGTENAHPPSGPGGASIIVFTNGGGSTLNISFDGMNISGGNDSLFSATVVGYTPGGSVEFPMTLDMNSDGSRSVSFPGFDSVALIAAVSHWATNEPNVIFNYNVGQTVGLWSRTYDNPYNPPPSSFDDWEQASDLAVDAFGNIIVTGTSAITGNPTQIHTLKYSPSGGQLWKSVYSAIDAMVGPKIAIDDNNDVYITDAVQPVSGNRDILTLKVSSAGVQQWAKTYDGGQTGLDDPFAIAVDQYRNVYVAGSAETTPGHSVDYVTMRYGTNGDSGWVRTYNGPSNDRDAASAIAVDIRNNVIVTGGSVGSVPPYTDIATIKYSQLDARAVSINSPPASVKKDSTVVPSVTVKNNGGIEATFNVVLHIGSFYSGSALVANLQPESLRVVMLAPWSVTQSPGMYAVLCSTQLGDDFLRGNDVVGTSVTVESTAVTSTDVNVQAGWNLVSVPRAVGDYLKTTLFPSASGKAFFYEGVYVAHDTLENGRGFWLKFGSPQAVSVYGTSIGPETTGVVKGWNIIGSISSAVPVTSVSSIPGGITTSPFYKYGGSYSVADTIVPGSAYWVKASQSGSLVLSAGPASAATGIRILRTEERPPDPPETISGSAVSIPSEFGLDQNYPNPFNPSTTIRYRLPDASHVRLVVLDVLGREIATLVDDVQSAGFKSVVWDAGNLAGGVYFYRLKAGNYEQSKKFVLVK